MERDNARARAGIDFAGPRRKHGPLRIFHGPAADKRHQRNHALMLISGIYLTILSGTAQTHKYCESRSAAQ